MNPLFDPRKWSCVDRLTSSKSWLNRYNTVVHKISGELSACANSGYQALLSQVGQCSTIACFWSYSLPKVVFQKEQYLDKLYVFSDSVPCHLFSYFHRTTEHFRFMFIEFDAIVFRKPPTTMQCI